MAATYGNGNRVRIRGTFKNVETGALVNPDTVSLTVTPPTGSPVTYTYPATITRESTGQYLKEIMPTVNGKWSYEWTATGEGASADPGNFKIR